MLQLPGYQTLAELHRGPEITVLRAASSDGGRSLIIKTHTTGKPSSICGAALRHEHALLKRVSSTYVVGTLGDLETDTRYALLLRDIDAESLERVLRSRPVTRLEMVGIGRAVARGLRDLHAARIVHGAVNPTNIIVNSHTSDVQIIDLSNAVDLYAPAAIARLGKSRVTEIGYISPEQAAHLDQLKRPEALDSRSDLYALGCVLYELATGSRPFGHGDASHLVHAHIAKSPSPPHLLAPDLPVELSRIVTKLLQKAPAARYQTAAGLDRDLELCQRQLRGGLEFPPNFVPGRYDDQQHFQLSDRIYGRESEMQTLRTAFAQFQNEGAGLAFVEGVSGIGKTALVNAMNSDPAFGHVRILAGKFDQSKGTKPYSGLVDAFSTLLHEVLSASASKRAKCQSRLMEEFGNDVGVLIELFPGLSELVGTPQPNAVLSPEAAANRLRYFLKRLLKVIASNEHPLILFLDDLQWADSDSSAVVMDVASDRDVSCVFVICACRSEALAPLSPVAAWLERLYETNVRVTRVSLGPLSVHAIRELLADTLIHSDLTPDGFAQRIRDRCEGNPFYLHQYLVDLHAYGLIYPDSSEPGWYCAASSIGDPYERRHPAELLQQQLAALPAATRTVLCQAAFLGHEINPNQLAHATGLTPEAIVKALTPATERGLVRTIAAGPKSSSADHPGSSRFTFTHDRVQQAASEALPIDEREALRLELGRYLLCAIETEKTLSRESLFAAMALINASENSVTDLSERLRLARVNMEVASRARRSTAFADALGYLRQAQRFFPESLGSRYHAERAELAYYLAEAEHLVGTAEAARTHAYHALAHATAPLLRSDIYNLLIVQHTLAGEYQEALRIGQQALKELGLDMPLKASARAARLSEREKARRLVSAGACMPSRHAGPVADQISAALRVMINLLPPTDFASPHLNHWLAARGVTLSHECGQTPEYPKLLINFANTLIMGDDFGLAEEPAAFRLAEDLAARAVAAASRPGAKSILPRVLYTFVCYIHHWTHPISESREFGDRAFKACQNAGEMQYAGYVLAFHKVMNELFIADTMAEHEARLQEHTRFANSTRNTIAGDVIEAARLPIAKLRAVEGAETETDSGAGEALVKRATQAENLKAVCLFHILEGLVALVHEDPERALRCAEAARPNRRYVSTTVVEAVQRLVFALAHMASSRDGWSSLRSSTQQKIDRTIARFESLATLCPSNFLAIKHLLAAERHRLQGEVVDAIAEYDASIANGNEFGFPPISALATELAARFWDDLGHSFIANAYWLSARDRYHKFGAQRKVTILDARLSRRDVETIPPTLPGALTLPELSTSLDRDAMIGTALAVAGELRLDDILKRSLTLLIERSGAQSGALLLAQDTGALRIEARGNVSENGIDLQLGSQAFEVGCGLPVSIVEAAQKRMEPVLLADALNDATFSRDACVKATGTRSALCVPLIQQQCLVGVVYLENRLTPDAFTKEQIGLIEFLASVAAMSITKAMLVQTLEQKVAERTAELEHQRMRAERDRAAAINATRAKSVLLANVSHELRTPLNAIIGFSDTLNRLHSGQLKPSEVDYLKPREPTYMSEIYQAGQHLLELINEMLDLSRIEAGQVELHVTETSVEQLVASSRTFVSQRARENDIDMRTVLDDTCETMCCDARRVKQVLINLLSNAVKFTPRGGVVTVRTRTLDKEICFEISDTGPGIPEADQTRIFEPFVRLEHSDREVGGTGLGLSVSKEVVHLHGGGLFVENNEHGGATFTIRLPRVAQ